METTEFYVPSIVIPVHRIMVFIAINNNNHACLHAWEAPKLLRNWELNYCGLRAVPLHFISANYN